MQTRRISELNANTFLYDTLFIGEKIWGNWSSRGKISTCVLPNTVVPCVLWASRTLS